MDHFLYPDHGGDARRHVYSPVADLMRRTYAGRTWLDVFSADGRHCHPSGSVRQRVQYIRGIISVQGQRSAFVTADPGQDHHYRPPRECLADGNHVCNGRPRSDACCLLDCIGDHSWKSALRDHPVSGRDIDRSASVLSAWMGRCENQSAAEE